MITTVIKTNNKPKGIQTRSLGNTREKIENIDNRITEKLRE